MIAVTHPTNSAQRAYIDTSGPNLVTDVTKGISNLQEVKDSFNAAWQWATKEGVMCDENMRGIRYNLQDITPRVSTPFFETLWDLYKYCWNASFLNGLYWFQFFLKYRGNTFSIGRPQKNSPISQWTRPQHFFWYPWPSWWYFLVLYGRVSPPPPRNCCYFFSLFVPTHNRWLTGTFFLGAGLFATKK